MNLPEKPSLSAQRCLLQEQLRAQREEIIAQFCKAPETDPQFPRSVTMRLLTGRVGLKILTGIALRQLVVRYPKVLANAFTFMRLFKSK